MTLSYAFNARLESGLGWWLLPPPWAEARVHSGRCREETIRLATGPTLTLISREAGTWHLLSARLALAAPPAGPPTDRVAREVYRVIFSRLESGTARRANPVRFWNFIPAISAIERDGMDRYRCFNIGRHAALTEWFGAGESFARQVPTATGVGHDGNDFVVHCLARSGDHESFENPRQRPAYRYSKRYGPVGPSFARATLIGGETTELIVGGTSSVRGEDSVHAGDVRAQFGETLDNLRALIAHAQCAVSGVSRHADPLTQLTSVRVYHVSPNHLDHLALSLGSVLTCTADIEFLRADICRPELLVEIEGVACLDASPLEQGAAL